MNEVWKDVVHYEGLYEVSNLGRVRNKQTQKIKAQTSNYNKTTNKGGYLTVQLWKNNRSKREYVHRLVAMAFIPNPDHKPQVNHKDEIKTNNEVSNLEWVTCLENNNYGTHIERLVEANQNNGTYEAARERMTENNPNKGQFTRGRNGAARKVICDGVIYDCIKDCAEHYNINYGTFRGYLSTYMPKKFKALGLGYI